MQSKDAHRKQAPSTINLTKIDCLKLLHERSMSREKLREFLCNYVVPEVTSATFRLPEPLADY